MRRLLPAAVLSLAAVIAPAPAAGETWSKSAVIDADGLRPDSNGLMSATETNEAGAVLLAWTGPSFALGSAPQVEYVGWSFKPAGGSFTASRRDPGNLRLLDAAMNESGTAVLLVHDQSTRWTGSPYGLRFVEADGDLAAVMPLPHPTSESVGSPIAVELDPAGQAVVLWHDARLPHRLYAQWLLTSGERRVEPIGEGLDRRGGRVRLWAGPDGRISIFFLAAPGTWNGRWSVYEALGDAAGGFGPAIAVSGIETASPDPFWPAIAGNPRGDLALLAAGKVRIRPAGGAWGEPEELKDSMPEGPLVTSQATVAMSRNGAVYVAWPYKGITAGSYRPPGGRFGIVEALSYDPTWGLQWPQTWFDRKGNLVYAYYANDLAFRTVIRPPDGAAGAPVELGPVGQQAKVVGLAAPAGGPELVFWARSIDGYRYDMPRDTALRATAYKPEPRIPAPVVARVTVRTNAISLRLSKQATIEIRFVPDVPHGLTRRTLAKIERGGRRGRNRIELGRKLRRRLSRRASAAPRVRVVVAARDGRGRRSRERQVPLVLR